MKYSFKRIHHFHSGCSSYHPELPTMGANRSAKRWKLFSHCTQPFILCGVSVNAGAARHFSWLVGGWLFCMSQYCFLGKILQYAFKYCHGLVFDLLWDNVIMYRVLLSQLRLFHIKHDRTTCKLFPKRRFLFIFIL